MTRREFAGAVRKALKELPKEFKAKLDNIDFVVESEPDMGEARMRKLGGRGRLLGLYEGIPLKERTHYYGMVMPDKVTLYQKNIERVCRAQGLDIIEEVRRVIEHEIAHHFGISDRRLLDLDIY